jgi:hypothetical protein
MGEIFGKNYYLDLDAAVAVCKTGDNIQDEDGKDIVEINVFKYEMVKMAIDRILGEIDEVDEEMGVFGQKNTSISFRLAFNTLIKYGIIIEENEDNE